MGGNQSATCCNPSSDLSQCCAAKDSRVDLNRTYLDPAKRPAVRLPVQVSHMQSENGLITNYKELMEDLD